MIPKTSWVMKVNWLEFSDSTISQPGDTVELPIKEQVGGKLEIGDEVYLLKEKTFNPDSPGGIFSVGQIISVTENYIKLHLDEKRLTNIKRPLKFSALNNDSTIGNLEKKYSKDWQINLLSPQISLRLEIISIKFDTDFDWADSMRCLLAYDECQTEKLSISESRPVLKASIETGRLISSVKFKLGNFRSLDQRVNTKGFENVSKIDQDVWNHYFNKTKNEINSLQLRDDVARHQFVDPLAFVVEDQNEPLVNYDITNDKETLQFKAIRIRRGQSRFRKALLTLYASQCAFTKTNEETVLEACHIIPHAKTGDNSIDNGLLLRSDIHVLFDECMITIADNGEQILIRKDVTVPEYAILNNTSPKIRPLISEKYLNLIRERNKELIWLK